jgi:hypothetical protein
VRVPNIPQDGGDQELPLYATSGINVLVEQAVIGIPRGVPSIFLNACAELARVAPTAPGSHLSASVASDSSAWSRAKLSW